MEQAPDCESSSDISDDEEMTDISDDEEMSVGVETREDRRRCILCLDTSSGIFVYPCACQHGISTSHLVCFDAYRNSWPLDHPNRNFCSYCSSPFDIASTTIDLSQHRDNNYVICYTMMMVSLVYTIPVLFVEQPGIPYEKLFVCLFLTNIYNALDMIFSTLGVSKLKNRWCVNIMTMIPLSCALTISALYQTPIILSLYAVLINGAMLKRVVLKRKEFNLKITR